MRNRSIKHYRPCFVLLLLITLFFSPLKTKTARAAQINLTTRADWNTGSSSSLETYSKEGQIQLEADGYWGARNWRSPDKTISIGSAFASDGTDLYVHRGYGDVLFWKYSPTKDQWTDLAILPYGTYYGSDMEIFGDYIYMIFGGFQSAFARYSISDNSWETLESLPDLVYEGGSLVTDGTSLYALRGYYSQDFYKYNVAEDTWSPMAGPPSTIRRGADLVHDEGYLYTPRGYNNTAFYRYDIAANTWTSMATVPGTMYDDVNITTDGDYIYAPRQNGGTDFYRYDIAANTWTTLADAPAGSRYAGVVYNNADDMVYFFRGNGQYHFWKYDPNEDEFLGPADTPSNFYTGSDLVYHDGYLYSPRGNNQTTFYRYNIATNAWETRASSLASFYDDTKGVAAGNYLYFYRGYNTSLFYRYDPSGNSWSEMASTPANARYGGTLAYPGSGDYIYGTRGTLTSSFWRYSISGNTWDDAAVADLPTDAEASYGSRTVSDGTDIYFVAGSGISRFFKYDVSEDTWTEMSLPPFSPFYGTDMSYYNGKIYAIAGWYKTNVYEYNISSDTWRQIKPLAGYYATDIGTYAGASIENDGNGTFYVTRASNLYDMQTYTVGSNEYAAQGTWTSETQDLNYVSSWTSLIADSTLNSDSNISYQTRTSEDNVSWSNWQTVSGTTIASPTNRYLQIKATLNASTGQNDTPILKSITINYQGDENPPNNPDTFNAFSQQIGGDTLNNGESYSHTNPYFSWSGASDGESNIAGYYVYFGTDSNADPATLGEYQTSNNYYSSTELSTGTYYLRLKTKDQLDNLSAAVTGFTYQYNGISPALNLSMTTTIDFSGDLTNINNANDQLKLSNKAGFWLQNRVSFTPGSMRYGAKTFAYVESSGKIYVLRGNNWH